MRLPRHNRYDYSAIVDRADYDWPDGKRLAVYIGLNIEDFAFGQGLGHAPTPTASPNDQRSHAWREYGLRVGVWRLFDLLDELGLPACHLVNSTIAADYPPIVAKIAARGDEIIGHGRTNSETQGDLAEADEAALIAEATEAFVRAGVRRPEGWMGPWIAETPLTPDLLKEAGYRFIMDWPCDDQPIWMRTRSGPLLAVPYPAEVNDVPAVLRRGNTAAEFSEMIVEQFDEMLRQSARHPLVFGLAIHTMVMGQPFRLPALRAAFQYMIRHPDADRVWFTRPGEIARHVAGLPKGIVPGS